MLATAVELRAIFIDNQGAHAVDPNRSGYEWHLAPPRISHFDERKSRRLACVAIGDGRVVGQLTHYRRP